MIVFILSEKRSYRKLYRRWFDSSIDVLTDRNDLESKAKISSALQLRLTAGMQADLLPETVALLRI